MIALAAFFSGLWQVIRAPFTLLAVLIITVVTAAPFGLVMGSRLQSALNEQPPVMLGSEEIDADWWLEFRRHAEGLNATFTPAIIGFAAPLSNLSGILDGTRPDPVMALPIAIAIVTWAFIWGWAIERFRSGGSKRAGALIQAGFRTLPKFVAISVVAMIAQVILYLTIHSVLFGQVFPLLTSSTPDERTAFFIRVALYLIFGIFLAGVSLLADYARIGSVLGRGAWSESGFVKRNASSVAALFLITTIILGALFVLYGVGEAYGGSRVAGWRGVAIGQAFIIVRLAMRIVVIASEVRLFERLRSSASS
jgi:hypothetical protein